MKRNSALPGGPTAMRSVCPRSTKRNVNAAITASANAIASSDENDVSTRNDRRNVRRKGRIIDLSSGPWQPDCSSNRHRSCLQYVKRMEPRWFMSAWGHSRRSRFGRESACPPISDMSRAVRFVAMCHKQSFDHLGGAGDQGRRKADAERLRRLEIDDELEVRGQLEQHVRGPRAV